MDWCLRQSRVICCLQVKPPLRQGMTSLAQSRPVKAAGWMSGGHVAEVLVTLTGLGRGGEEG
jgi:hypothetical protein